MLILNIGGTLNKRYNHIKGELQVPFDNYALEKILDSVNIEYDLSGVLYKDSLDMTLDDIKLITNVIMESKDNEFIIIHGTDTIDKTAEFLDEMFGEDRKIILTGAMKPFEVDNIEATLNIGMSMGYMQSLVDNGTYICMSGFVQKYDKLVKNRALGKFELAK